MPTIKHGHIAIVLTIAFGWIGCGSGAIELQEDSGLLCLRAIGESDLRLPEGQPLELVVHGTFSLDHEPISGSCSVGVQDGEVHVTSEFVVKRRNPGSEEPLEIVPGSVSCPVDALEAGEYQLVHGDRVETIFVPSDDVLECARIESEEPSIDDEWRF